MKLRTRIRSRHPALKPALFPMLLHLLSNSPEAFVPCCRRPKEALEGGGRASWKWRQQNRILSDARLSRVPTLASEAWSEPRTRWAPRCCLGLHFFVKWAQSSHITELQCEQTWEMPALCLVGAWSVLHSALCEGADSQNDLACPGEARLAHPAARGREAGKW